MAKKHPGRKPAKRDVSVVELRLQAQHLEGQAKMVADLAQRITALKHTELEVRGLERFVRANASLNDYLADLSGAVTRLELERSTSINGKK